MVLSVGPEAHRRRLAGSHGGRRRYSGGKVVVPSHSEANRGAYELCEGKEDLDLGFRGTVGRCSKLGRLHGGATAPAYAVARWRSDTLEPGATASARVPRPAQRGGADARVRERREEAGSALAMARRKLTGAPTRAAVGKSCQLALT